MDIVPRKQVGANWAPVAPLPAGCDLAKAAGKELHARPCQANGIAAADQSFELLPDWQLRHVGSQLCATAAAATDGAKVTLEKCVFNSTLQKFKNDYTRVRNTVEPFTLVASETASSRSSKVLTLAGAANGTVTVAPSAQGKGSWATWSAFPNTNQVRNQYTANTGLGYPMCLSVCAAA